MLLTRDLIDRLHQFRVGVMERSVARIPAHEGARIGAGYARFAGAGSPLSQAYGLSYGDTAVDLTTLDNFFGDRAQNWELIITPFDSPAFLAQATRHGYIPDHFETVMVMTVEHVTPALLSGIAVEELSSDLDVWSRTSEAGWLGLDEIPDELSPLGQIMSTDPTVRRFLASIDGAPAGTASLIDFDGSFLMAGASTLSKFRGQGVQKTLTHRRLTAAGEGALIQVVTLPGSESHRNAQRMGFQPLYSKLVLMRNPE